MHNPVDRPNDLPWLVLTIGLPRSGKSTWARDHSDTYNAPIVCPDSIRKALGCYPFDASRESEVWHIAHVMVEALFHSDHSVVVLDATNIKRTDREKWLSPHWNVEYVIFPTGANICKGRARLNDQDYLLPVIDRMAERADWQAEIDDPECGVPYSVMY